MDGLRRGVILKSLNGLGIFRIPIKKLTGTPLGRIERMHLYWRIIEELKVLGETWTIINPNLLRCYRIWLEQHSDAIERITEDETAKNSKPFSHGGLHHSLN
jgi:hypothetical protein